MRAFKQKNMVVVVAVVVAAVAAAAEGRGGGTCGGGSPDSCLLHEVQILFAAFNETDGQRAPSTHNGADSGVMAWGLGIVRRCLVMGCVNK